MDSNCEVCFGDGLVSQERKSKSEFPNTEDGKLVGRLCDLETLSSWESAFCDSVVNQVAGGRELTEKQIDKIEQILSQTEKK